MPHRAEQSPSKEKGGEAFRVVATMPKKARPQAPGTEGAVP